MTLDTFADVAGLDIAAQTALLHDGVPIEQVWAAWALALERGKEIVPTLVTTLDAVPDPGARHFMLVILAGLGERALLLTLAEHDPDDLVRATACQYSLRCCAPSDRQTLRVIAARLLADPSAYVQQVILQEAPHILFSLSPAERAAMCAAVSPSVRGALYAALRQISLLSPQFIDAQLAVEEDGPLRSQLLTFHVEAGGALAVLHMAYGAPLAQARGILNVLIAQGCRFDLGALAPLEARAEYTIDVALASLLDDAEDEARLWLLWRIARASATVNRWTDEGAPAVAVAARLAPLYALQRSELLRRVRAARQLWREKGGRVAMTLPIHAITRYTRL